MFIIITYRIRHSRFGRALAYIREDKDAAQAMGVDCTRYKLYAYILGAAFFAIFLELFRDIPVIGNMRMLFFGFLLIVVMITRPQGLWPERKELR